MALAYETVYGTAPASGYFTMPFARSTLGTEQPLLENELLGYGRDPLAPQRDAITSDGDVVIPVDVTAIGYWLKALLGQPTTTGTTPRTHTFTSGGNTLPSMAIEIGNPEVPNFEMFTGVMVDRMQFSLERSGLLQATASLVAQGSVNAAATAAGTPTAITLQRFGHFNGSIRRNSTLLANIVSAEFTYANNLDRVETIRSDGRIEGADPGNVQGMGNIVSRFEDTTLLNQAINGTSCTLELAWSISANQSLTFTFHEVYLPRPRRPIEGPLGIQAQFDWMAARASGAPNRMMTAVLVNAQTSY
jgi:hypothetical protein